MGTQYEYEYSCRKYGKLIYFMDPISFKIVYLMILEMQKIFFKIYFLKIVALMMYNVPQDIPSNICFGLWKLYISIYGKSSKNESTKSCFSNYS